MEKSGRIEERGEGSRIEGEKGKGGGGEKRGRIEGRDGAERKNRGEGWRRKEE